MVPIYAIDSVVALVAYEYGSIMALVRDTYEAYVIYQFYYLLMDYLGGEENVVLLWKEQNRGGENGEPCMNHLFPMNLCLNPLPLTHSTLMKWKICLVQYMVINPFLTLLAIPLYFTGYYSEGVMVATNAYLWFSAIRFVSVSFAFTSLVYFFFATKDFLEPHKPIAKFAAIKAVVFVLFWQSVLLAGLNHFGVIPSTKLWTADEVSTGLQNFVVCIEMYVACLAHRWIFTDAPYLTSAGRFGLQRWAVMHMLSVSDVIENTQDAISKLSPKNGARDDPTSYQLME
jgi:hypothetical protein